MANQIVVQIIGDPDNLKKVLSGLEGDAKISGSKIGDLIKTGTNSGFAETAIQAAKTFGGMALIAGAAFFEVRKIISDVFEGENLKAINEQFNLLAANAGVAGDALKESLEKSSGGLVKESELIQAANRSLVQFSGSAKQLPELLELARKTSLLFGGSVVENFEAINQAIASGNARALRHVGIVIDQNKALKDFAISQGVSVDALSRAGREQAIMNAALEKGRTSFDGINPNIRENNNNWTDFKVAISDAAEVLTKKNETVFGPIIASITGGMAKLAKIAKDDVVEAFGQGFDQVDQKRQTLERQLNGAIEQSENLQKRVKFDPLAQESLDFSIKKIEDYKLQISLLDEELRKHNTQLHQTSLNAKKDSIVDPEKFAADQAKIATEFQKFNNDLIQEQLKHNQNEDDIQRLFDLQIEQTIKETNLKEENVKRELRAKNLISQEQYNRAIELLEAQKNAKIKNLQNEAAHSENEITKTVKSGIVQGLTSAFSGLGRALATSGNGFQALSNAVIQAIGAIAIQVGSLLVTMGLGFESIGIVMPTWAAAGAGAVVEGLALITLGGALSAVGGSTPSGAGGGAGESGGSIGGSPIGANTATDRPASPGTQVEVHIHGNVFDNRETGLAIVQAINDSFGSNGVVLARQS